MTLSQRDIDNGVQQVMTIISSYSIQDASEVLHQANKRLGAMVSPPEPPADNTKRQEA